MEDARGDQGAACASQTRGARRGFRGFHRCGEHGGHRGVRRRCGSSAEGERSSVDVFGGVVQHRGDPEDREGTGRIGRPNAEHWPAFCSHGRLLTVCVASRGQRRRATRKHGGGSEWVTEFRSAYPTIFARDFGGFRSVSSQNASGLVKSCRIARWLAGDFGLSGVWRTRFVQVGLRGFPPDFMTGMQATFADYNSRTRPYKGWELNSGCSSFVSRALMWPRHLEPSPVRPSTPCMR